MPRTAIAVPRQVVRDFGTCLDYTGSTSSKVIPTTSIDPTTAMTICCWLKLKSLGASNSGRITAKHVTSSGYTFLCQSTNRIAFQINLTTSITTPNNSFSLGQWFLAACTYDNSLGSNNAQIYINGTSVVQGNDTSIIQSDGSTQNIGGLGDSSRTLDGKLDDYRFYTRALSATELLNLYYGIEPATTNLQMRYKFDEGSGTTAIDSSGNGNTGAITAATYSSDVFMVARSIASARTTAGARTLI